MKSPIKWFGGKFYMLSELLPMIPSHRHYVEVFGGGGQLLFAKTPSLIETYNDLDSRLVNFFRVLRDKEKFAEFHRQVSLVPYSREEYYSFRDTYDETEDEIEKAVKFFCVARMSFGGKWGVGGWGFQIADGSSNASKMIASIKALPEIHKRLLAVQIEHLDYKKLIKYYDSPETFFYLDPPYVASTRRNGGYKHEMTDEDHQNLVAILLGIEGKAILSGYNSDLYSPLLQAGWERKDFSRPCAAVGRTKATGLKGECATQANQQRIESIWISPNAKRQMTLF